MAFGIEIQSWVLGRKVEKERAREREREREESAKGLWVLGIGFAFYDFGKIFWASYCYFL